MWIVLNCLVDCYCGLWALLRMARYGAVQNHITMNGEDLRKRKKEKKEQVTKSHQNMQPCLKSAHLRRNCFLIFHLFLKTAKSSFSNHMLVVINSIMLGEFLSFPSMEFLFLLFRAHLFTSTQSIFVYFHRKRLNLLNGEF